MIGNRCRYDWYNDVNIIFKQDRSDAYLRGSYAITDQHTAFAELLFSRVKTDYFSTPPSFQVTARFSMLLRGSPSARVFTLTRISPSSLSVMTA